MSVFISMFMICIDDDGGGGEDDYDDEEDEDEVHFVITHINIIIKYSPPSPSAETKSRVRFLSLIPNSRFPLKVYSAADERIALEE